MNELIDKASVSNTYSGAEGCACGCNGTYVKSGATVARRVNEVNNAIADGEMVQVYNSAWGDCYEYSKPNGRVVRVYTKKD